MELNRSEIVAEVTTAFYEYERALTSNDVETLDSVFRNAPTTIRYGINENLYGYEEIAAFRAARASTGLDRTLSRTVITTYGSDFATAMTLFERAPGRIGRQSQTWVRFGQSWHVVAAHVSVIDA